jgi:hypothetical protein
MAFSYHYKLKQVVEKFIYFILMKEVMPDFMEMDCDEIDRTFLPPNAFRDALLTPISGIAPPQGNPFLAETRSMEQMLKGMPSVYR